MKLFLYRTVDSDEDGDPLDFGVLRAFDTADALKIVQSHLFHLGFEDPLPDYWIYELFDSGLPGVIKSRTRFNPKTKD